MALATPPAQAEYAARLVEACKTLDAPWAKNAAAAMDLLLTETGRTIGVERTLDGRSTYVVASRSHDGTNYHITLPEGCPCGEAQHKRWHCAHLVAVELWLRLQGKTLQGETMDKTVSMTAPAEVEGAALATEEEADIPNAPALHAALAALVADASTAYPAEAGTIRTAASFVAIPGFRIENGWAEYPDVQGELHRIQGHCAKPCSDQAPAKRCVHRWAYNLGKRFLAAQATQEETPAQEEAHSTPLEREPKRSNGAPRVYVRSYAAIMADLARPLPPQFLKEKVIDKASNRKAKFIPHYLVAAILDHVAPGWQSEIVRIDHQEVVSPEDLPAAAKAKRPLQPGGVVRTTLRLGLPTSDYGMVWRTDIGESDDWQADPDQYGSPGANSKANALRRVAALGFGLGRDLYDTDRKLPALAAWLRGK